MPRSAVLTHWLLSRLVLLAVTGLPLSLLSPAPLSAQDKPVDFSREVRPILSDLCFKCHGPDEKERQARLRLDTSEGALAALESGAHAIVPGDPAKSSLIERITTDDPDRKMPPVASGKKLTPQQIETLKRWIAQGAGYRQHWSFVKPEKHPLPAVPSQDWARTPIDHFVLAKLEASGLKPNPQADKVTLIRRATFDLTGLPATPEEIDAFLADESPQAFEKVVDRLLQSPRFGEHMARYWLDLARYGDTHGLHLDNERSLWKYREWVIAAFNANLPFDQFTIQQLAGDLLPEATLEQRIASGFNRCNVTTSEGGSIDEEVRIRYVVDRTETMATAWLGLTLGCAVCHDHKYDPVSQKEFYALSGFFNSAADAAMDGNALSPPPVIKVPTEDQTKQLAEYDRQLADLNRRIAEALAQVEYTDPLTDPAKVSADPKEFVWIDDAAPAGAQLQGNSPWEFVGKEAHPVHSGEKSHRRSAAGLTQHFFTGANPPLKVGEGDKFFTWVFLDAASPPKEIMLQWNDGSWEHRAYWGGNHIDWGASDSPSRYRAGDLPKPGEWVRIEVDCAKVGLGPGANINGWAFTQFDGTVYWDRSGIVTKTLQAGQSFDSQLEWEAVEKTLTQSAVPQPVRDAIKVEPDKRSDDQKKQIRDYFLEHVCGLTKPVFDPLKNQRADLTKKRTDLDNSIPTTLVMADMGQARETFVLVRGAYDKRGDKVETGTPAVFPALPENAPRNRLGLAQWLVDPAHPLTARVTVNRFWQQLFGRGIVKTSEDFGSQGEWPTHPELLDWLAVDFRENQWDMKRFFKQVLMSATWQQSSKVSPELFALDPENALLARGARFRLDAEAVRDTALSLSGLLVERLGGKSVKPYQPEGLWEAVAFVGSNTQRFARDNGEALYRRGLYTFWKRTSPPPSLLTFDAPSRENCIARRARTNTPLQALALMNDEQYVEASRFLAERILKQGGSTPVDQLSWGFRLTTGRRPDAEELALLVKLHDEQLAHFKAAAEDAKKLLAIGEAKRDESLDASLHAAMTMMANLLLNLDETITRE